MLKLADRYIIKMFLSRVFLLLIIFNVIFLLVDVVEHLDYIIESDISSSQMYLYYTYALPWYTSLGFPMALLLGVVFTTGILQKNNELTAIKAAGISIKRITVSLLLMGIAFCFISFYFENIIVSHFLEKRHDLGSEHNLVRVRHKNNSKNIFRQESKNKILGINNYSYREEKGRNIFIQTFNNNNLVSRFDTKEMSWNKINKNWEVKKFLIREWLNDSLIYKEYTQDTTLNLNFGPTDLTQSLIKPEEMNYWELKDFVKKINKFGINEPKWAVNMHFKTAFACTSFLMILFGISLSIRKPRSNIAVGVGLSISVIFIYYAAIMTGRSIGYKGGLDPFISVWLPNIIFFIYGTFLLYKTRT